MPINECCNTAVVTCTADASLFDVAELMRRHHVGTVIVTEGEGSDRVPTGIITDRDIVIEMLALKLDVSVFTAGDVMSAPVITVRESEGIIEALRVMRMRNVRRLPIITEAGSLYGIVTVDDLLSLLTMELSLVTGAIIGQRETESRLRRSHGDGSSTEGPGATQH